MQLVSVITPFFNTPVQFLQEAVESVFTQSCENWELLLVDDGSTSECSIVARQCAQDYPGKVRYLEHSGHKNLGLSASRNLGIAQARGEYIAFLDADDIWLPNKLKEQTAILELHPQAGMTYGNTMYWYSWTGVPKDNGRDFVPELGFSPNRLINPPRLLPLFLERKYAVPCTCSAIMRRATLHAIGGMEDSFNGMYEDQVLFAKASLSTPIYVSSGCWDKYRQHPKSMCQVSKDTGQELSSRRTYLKWLAQYLTQKQCVDQDVWQVLRRELWIAHHPVFGRPLKRAQGLIWRCVGRKPRL
jgi:glycosyltransferase involved in cell wall biosynthesis